LINEMKNFDEFDLALRIDLEASIYFRN